MAITHVGSGGYFEGTTSSVTVYYPSSIQAGDMLLAWLVSKPSTYPNPLVFVTEPDATWASVQSRTASAYSAAPTDDTGNMRVEVFRKIADGTETGSVTFTITGVSLSISTMQLWRCDTNQWSQPAYTFDGYVSDSFFAYQNDVPAGQNVTASNAFLQDIYPGDMVAWMFGFPTDAVTGASNDAMTQPTTFTTTPIGLYTTAISTDAGFREGYSLATATGKGTFTWSSTFVGDTTNLRGMFIGVKLREIGVPYPDGQHELSSAVLLAAEPFTDPGDHRSSAMLLLAAEEAPLTLTASLSVDRVTVYVGAHIHLVDTTEPIPHSRVWGFDGGVGSSTSDESVSVYWDSPGTKTVTLDTGYLAQNDQTTVEVTVLDVPIPSTVDFSLDWVGTSRGGNWPDVAVPATVDPTATLVWVQRVNLGGSLPLYFTEIYRDTIVGSATPNTDMVIGTCPAYEYVDSTIYNRGTETRNMAIVIEMRNGALGDVASISGTNGTTPSTLVLDTSALNEQNYLFFAHSSTQTINIGNAAWTNQPVLESGSTADYLIHVNGESSSGIAYAILQAWTLFDDTLGNTVTLNHHTSNGNYGWGTMALELIPVPYVTPRISVWTGSQAIEGTPYLWDGSQVVDAAMRAIPYGYSSVNDMLSRSTFYWSHRGGSAVVPEMSLYAYTRSADQGFGGLEVSVNRTSDGVWFGLHDQTLLRTSGVDIDPTTLTWAEVQQYQIAAPAGYPQPAQPYMRLDELIEAYGSSHVLIVDPKNRLGEASALFDYILTMQPATRLIAKYAGNGRSLADIVRPKGIKSWGYYYESSWEANKTYATAWDLLGMEWNASQATWDDVLSYGKPTVAHICATRTAADTGISKGAHGIQTSGIFNVLNRNDS